MPPITTPTPLPPLEEDVFCRCGYNLRGLPASGRCPECGRKIELALDPTREPVSAAEARFVMWSCACFLLAVFLIHHEWFVRRTRDDSPRLIAATAMAAGSWLLSLTRKPSHRLSSEAVHAALFRGVVVAWVIIAILVQPGWLVSGINPTHVDVPLLFLPVASLYFMLEALSRWHARLGGRALARVLRVTSWLFPLVVLCSRQTFWNITRVNVIGGLPRRQSDLVWFAATGLFFVIAFLIGVTWYASLDAANESPRRADDQN